jgi:endonuclease YncB( thermonuclease family)
MLVTPLHAVTLKTSQAISGDEIVRANNTHVRLIGIYAPLNTTLDLAIATQNKLGSLMAAQKFTLENAATDRYGYTAADVYVDNTWLQSEMLHAGLAFIMHQTATKNLPNS